MTKIAKLFEQEKLKAVQKAKEEAKREDAIKFAMDLIELGHDDEVIIRKTGLTQGEVSFLRGHGRLSDNGFSC